MRYQKLLNKMFVIEVIGEALYNALYAKEEHKDLKAEYKRLANNEIETRKTIEKEVFSLYQKKLERTKKFFACLSRIFFRLLSKRQLERLLRNALKRKMYSQWFLIYNEKNNEFWDRLLMHEELQHQFLGSYREEKTKEEA